MKVEQRYFVTRGDSPEREVDRDQYMYAQVMDANIVTTNAPIAFSVPGFRGRIKTEIKE